ncbi:PTS sugar transporter subunit IIC [Lacticaseibacillus suibinensis]|uniref:PTS sugar transporter subunit IIC n=1 Tax=Lacticaseibacillus suibinensis TaxID=2486011 RepID=UPI001943BE79|nr:PTS transporter subunit EIIC [Lacticaseibacillus suibinensis]
MAKESRFQASLEKLLVPISTKIGSNKILKSLSEGMIMTLPLTLGASLFMVLGNFPVPAVSNWLNAIGIGAQLNAIAGGTLSILALYISFTVAYSYAKQLKAEATTAGILSLASFLVIMPQTVGEGKNIVGAFAGTYLGSQGIFVAILVGLVVSGVYARLSRVPWLTIKLPDSVPPMIANSFAPLLVSLIIFLGDFLVRLGFSYTQWANIFDFINKIIAAPLVSVGGSVPAFILVYMLANLFFWFGLHPAPIQSIMQTIATSMMLVAVTNNADGTPVKYLTNLVVFDFVNNDGTGSTLSLLIAIFIFGRAKRYRSLAKLAIIPNIFGINEPVVFGLPIMFNALMIIPFVFSTLVSAGIAWIAVKVGFIATYHASVAMSMPWTLPKFITSFFIYGWQGVVLRLFIMAVLVVLYLPFLKMLDKKELDEETGTVVE